MDWFSDLRQSEGYKLLQKKPLAYFSIEYALSDYLPTYAGGLGVLAGDYVRELADSRIPAIAVGLYYQTQYGARNLSLAHSPFDQNIRPVLNKNGEQVVVKVPIQDHDVYVKAWRWQENSIPVYLLDTNVPENTGEDRQIGFKLYDANKETRLKQEMILGIGGFRLLETMGIQPSIFHMNEGHSVMLDLEIIRHEMQKRNIGFQEAIKMAGHHVVFTNHTLVAAGDEIFSKELVEFLLARYASELEVPLTDILELGAIKDSGSFSLSLFARRLAGKINSVSRIHGKQATNIWPDYEIEYVTNGIHLPTWDRIGQDSENNIIERHETNKKKLLNYIQDKTGLDWNENELLLGWARRMVSYKRPLALFGEIERLKKIVNKNTSVKIVMSGIAHQSDDEGREIMHKLQAIIKKEFSDNVVYLPDYNVSLAKLLTAGCDVWLNTPVVGSEACGTSGMKACLNGVLPCSTIDGWIDEVDLTDIGWTVDSDTVHVSLLDVLEENIIHEFYDHRERWNLRMKNGRKLIQKHFSATRMLREYFEKLYLPIITKSYEHYSS